MEARSNAEHVGVESVEMLLDPSAIGGELRLRRRRLLGQSRLRVGLPLLRHDVREGEVDARREEGGRNRHVARHHCIAHTTTDNAVRIHNQSEIPIACRAMKQSGPIRQLAIRQSSTAVWSPGLRMDGWI